MSKKIATEIAVGLIVIVALVIGALFWAGDNKTNNVQQVGSISNISNYSNDNQQPENTKEMKNEKTITWKKYTSKTLGIAFEYPSNWEPVSENQQNREIQLGGMRVGSIYLTDFDQEKKAFSECLLKYDEKACEHTYYDMSQKEYINFIDKLNAQDYFGKVCDPSRYGFPPNPKYVSLKNIQNNKLKYNLKIAIGLCNVVESSLDNLYYTTGFRTGKNTGISINLSLLTTDEFSSILQSGKEQEWVDKINKAIAKKDFNILPEEIKRGIENADRFLKSIELIK